MKNVIFYMLILILLTHCGVSDKNIGSKLESGFVNPPDSARPRVWWHWMNGNITKVGIRADLEWMHRVGIRGFQNFDAALMTPQIVEKRLVYMTPEWKDAFRFTTRLADSLGLEMAIAGSPGWSESGGPWVKPEQAMKKFVWSETRVEGGKLFQGILPKPPFTTGAFQNLVIKESFSLTGAKEVAPPEYYADAAVIAYRLPDADLSLSILKPKVTSSGGKFNLDALIDGDVSTSTLLPFSKPGENAWIMFEFAQPQAIQALTIVGGGYVGMFGFGADENPRTLDASDDGRNFKKVIDISVGGIEQKTLTFNPVTAKYFRFTWKTPMPKPAFNIGATFGFDALAMPKKPAGTKIAELVLYPVARVNRFEEKAAFAEATDLYSALTPEVKSDEAVKKAEVIDLTSKMNPDGSLEWTPPAGNWIIVRLGYSLTGHKNSPASPEATGLEVDKLNASHVKAYFNNYLDQYKDATGGLMGKKGLQYMITDSWEAGTQNWTDNMIAEFSRRRGYNMLPWIPVLTGHIVEGAKESDRFLWDFRKTLADLVAENHYDQLTEILKERGMRRYSESHESGRAFIGDGMEVKRKAAVPMSATWTPGGLDPGTEVATGYKADVRESASVAHIYGQNLVAAESMTAIGSAWAWSPETLKPTADMELANGLNRFVIHTSVHQPVNDKIPGLGLGPFGQWFTRHETWAEQAGPWMDYLARSCYMLQQGKFVADIVYFYGEDNNITALFGDKLPFIPEGYNYDFVNADALVNLLSVNNGLITTPGGMKYKVLVLDPNSRYMTLIVLKKIRDMVNSGAIVVGDKPVDTPSFSDNPDEFTAQVNELWANENGENTIGRGKIFAGQPLENILKKMNIIPDFKFAKPQDNTNLLFVHRQLGDVDFYWVNNRNSRKEELEATFRITGKTAEIWHPETGKTEQASYTMENGSTRVPIHLEANDAVFVVFRNKTSEKSRTVILPKEKQVATIEGPWNISFEEKRGAPENATFEKLTPWNENSDSGIKYFSGTGTYTKTINTQAEWFKEGTRLLLDLGSVKELAEVIINGKSMGIVWKTPFRVDVTEGLKQGENMVEIKVTNLWVNRLIGDQQPGVGEKITYTTMKFYRPDSPLKTSGLLGPVRLVSLGINIK
jgi:alpha-L-rhamnosidase/Glycosyl hydrolases family 2, sugar binding domain